MREKAGGLKNGLSKKEKYKALRKMRSVKRAEQQQKVAMKAMPPPLPKKIMKSVDQKVARAPPAVAPAAPPARAEPAGLPSNFFDNAAKPSSQKPPTRTTQPPTTPEVSSTKDALADLEGVARSLQAPKQVATKTTVARSQQASSSMAMGDAAIPSGFFDDPEKEMKARGITHDFSNEFESFNELVDKDKEKRALEEKDIQKKLKAYRQKAEETEAEEYQDQVSKMKKRAAEFKKRMLEKKKKRKAKTKKKVAIEQEIEVDPENVDSLLEDIAWRGKAL
eukprot:CAMPEP_0167783838 /NCGR_PEP_ID=MMETSP0111_2-20121227/7293_1 /TAXON_ID=91324 /ORGANISM="Lotharella globosa, Strain CCCM811" /LENGTH=278 /DNA_ID=CAMNT_0007674821 /DNA_START=6 /DNA_END=842 /DNA_ORIENTATION=+